jgi:hypothetical protein
VNGANSSKGVSASPTRTCRGTKWVGGGRFGKKALDEAVGVELRSRVLSLVSFLRLAWPSLARIPGTVSDLLRPRAVEYLGTLIAFKLHRDNPDQRLGRLGRMGERLCFQGMSYIILTCSFAALHWTTPPDPLGPTRRRGEGLRYNEVSQPTTTYRYSVPTSHAHARRSYRVQYGLGCWQEAAPSDGLQPPSQGACS